MWTNENRVRYDRSKLHYPSDLTDAQKTDLEKLSEYRLLINELSESDVITMKVKLEATTSG